MFLVLRFDPKDWGKQYRPVTLWQGPEGHNWRWNAPPTPRPLYGLDRLAARPDAPVIVCEGEKAANSAAYLFPSHVTVTSMGGALAAGKADWTPLAGRSVVVWPDNDEPGRTYAQSVAKILAAIGCEVAVIDAAALAVIDAPERRAARPADGWDAADAEAEEWSDLAMLRGAALALAKPFTPTPPDSVAGAEEHRLMKLAALGDLAYQRQRRAAAVELSVPLTALDRLVKARQKAKADAAEGGDGLPGRAIVFPAIEPWPQPVDGKALVSVLVDTVRSYVVLTAQQALAVVLWVIHTHALEAFDVSPRLVPKSKHKRCGKTTLMSVLQRLVAKPASVSGITAAALLRVIETHCPTVLIDEMDALMGADREMAQALRGLLNSGFDRRGASFVKLATTDDGDYEPRSFSTWAPLAAAGIGELPDTVRDRSIEIAMERKLKSETVKQLRRRDGADLDELACKIARFARDNLAALSAARPNMPEGLNDRASDAWEPLVAIADLCSWSDKAKEAALALSGAAQETEGDTNTMLLSDIRDIFEETNVNVLASEFIAKRLADLDDRPWAEWKGRGSMTKKQLSAKLRDVYRIRSTTVEVVEDDIPYKRKGYRLAQFKEAFSRYLPTPL